MEDPAFCTGAYGRFLSLLVLRRTETSFCLSEHSRSRVVGISESRAFPRIVETGVAFHHSVISTIKLCDDKLLLSPSWPVLLSAAGADL